MIVVLLISVHDFKYRFPNDGLPALMISITISRGRLISKKSVDFQIDICKHFTFLQMISVHDCSS